jgi:hypothetical protein
MEGFAEVLNVDFEVRASKYIGSRSANGEFECSGVEMMGVLRFGNDIGSESIY